MAQLQSTNAQPKVAVVLCTFNGAEYLETQVQSLVSQSYPVSIRVFDDGSSDRTLDIVSDLARQFDIQLFKNETNRGFVKNFEFGIRQVLEEEFDYIALSDQDDIWEENRVQAGMEALLLQEQQLQEHSDDQHSANAAKQAILVHSDLCMIDSLSRPLRFSFLNYRKYAIDESRNEAVILGQNGVMGNTILMNRALAEMALPFPTNLHVHDYWLAVVAELFGKRLFLANPLVAYRIHERNSSNSSGSTKFGLARLLDGKSINGFLKRDFKLPFKEDTRQVVTTFLLSNNGQLPALNSEQRATVTLFDEYLRAERGKFTMLIKMLRMGFFRKGVLHKMRVAFSLLTSARYSTKFKTQSGG